jgi:hypothetical protein
LTFKTQRPSMYVVDRTSSPSFDVSKTDTKSLVRIVKHVRLSDGGFAICPYGYRMTNRNSSTFQKVLKVLLPIALLLGLAFGNQRPANANVQGPVGGGGGYCPAEFQSCPPGSSLSNCTWYGWCGTGGDFGGGGGYGGGYGGGSYGTFIPCGTTGPQSTDFVYQGYVYIDHGSCATKRICNDKAADINASRPTGSTLLAVCGLSRADPVTSGRHLFVRG